MNKKLVKNGLLVFLTLLLLSVGYYILYFYGPQLGGELLKTIVSSRSNKAYSLDYKEINISIVNSTLSLKDLIILPNDSLIDDSKTLYRVQVPELELKIGSLSDMYLKKELTIKHIVVKNPDVSLISNARSERKVNFSVETGDLYKLISKYLFSFSIDSLEINKGAVSYQFKDEISPFELLMSKIDFKIKNLLLDSSSLKLDKFILTEDIRLILTDQKFLLPDSTHVLSFEEFEFSTLSQNILFRNLRLKEREQKSPFSRNINQYNVLFPELNFRGIDFARAYSKNELFLDSVRLLNPEVFIVSNKQRSDSARDDVPQLLAQLFSRYSIGKFYIENAKMAMGITFRGKEQIIGLHDINLEIDEFSLDSSNFNFDQRHAYFDSFKFSAEDYKLKLPDGSHQISFESLYISSADSILELKKGVVEPLKKKIPVRLTSRVPYLVLEGVDFAKYWLLNEVFLREINMTQPYIDLELSKIQNSDKNGIGPESIDIRSLNIQNAQLKITKGDMVSKFNNLYADIGNILHPSQSLSETLLKTNFENISAASSNFRNSEIKLDLGGFKITSDLRHSLIDGLNLSLRDNDEFLSIETIELTGLDPSRYFTDRALAFDTLTVVKPVVNVMVDTSSKESNARISDFVHHLLFERVAISEGQLNLYDSSGRFSHVDSMEIALTHFHYDSIADELYTGIDLHADSFHIILNKIDHELYGKSISISQADSTLDLKVLSLAPLSKGIKSNYEIATEELKLTHLDFHKLLNEQRLIFSKGLLRKPVINLEIERNRSAPENIEALDTVSNGLIVFDQLNVTDGILDIYLHETNTVIGVGGFNALVIDFDMDSRDRFYKAKNYIADAKQTQIILNELRDTLEVGYIIANTKKGDYTFNNLRYDNHSNMLLDIPQLKVKGMHTHAFTLEQKLWIDSLKVNSPKLNVGLGDQENNSSLPILKIGKIDINNANLVVHKPGLNREDSIELVNLDLDVGDLRYDSLTPDNFPSFSSVDFSGGPFEYGLPNGFNDLYFNRFEYESASKHLSVEGIQFIPLYNRGEFQALLTYQEDWLDGEVKSIQVEGLDIAQIFSEKILDASLIQVNELYLDTHRDKRLPRKSGLYKPLPQSWIRSLSFPTNIDSILVTSSYVSHSEFSETGDLPGKIYFQDINALITNITNDPQLIAENKYMNFASSGKLMQSGNFLLDVKFDLADSLNTFILDGKVGNMHLNELNEFLEHTSYVQISEGINKLVTFDFEANENYSVGSMTFYYDDLKISMLDKDTYDPKGLGNSIKSFFANTFVVNTKNPYFIFVRDGDIFTERNTEKSIFNFWAQSILSGLVSSIGAKNNKKEIKQQNEKIQAQYERIKDSHK